VNLPVIKTRLQEKRDDATTSDYKKLNTSKSIAERTRKYRDLRKSDKNAELLAKAKEKRFTIKPNS